LCVQCTRDLCGLSSRPGAAAAPKVQGPSLALSQQSVEVLRKYTAAFPATAADSDAAAALFAKGFVSSCPVAASLFLEVPVCFITAAASCSLLTCRGDHGGPSSGGSNSSFFRARPPAPSSLWNESAEYRQRLKTRQGLPIWDVHDDIMHAVRLNRVVVIAGETGCGKSTQVPQMLLCDPVLGPGCRIVVTQVCGQELQVCCPCPCPCPCLLLH
jgi:hypothetical protein